MTRTGRPSLYTLLVVLLLSGCVSSPQPSGGAEDADRQAAEVNTALGSGYLQRGDYEVALEKLQRAIEFDPRYAPAHSALGILYETIGEDRKAGEHYRRSARLDPDDGDIHNNYGQFLCRNGDFEAAEEHFLIATEDPFYRTPALAWGNAGTCALRAGDLDTAERYLRQALQYDAEFASALLPMASLSYRNGSYLQSRAFLQRYEAVAPASAESLWLGYRIESQLGRDRDANAYRQRLAREFPKSSQAAALEDQG